MPDQIGRPQISLFDPLRQHRLTIKMPIWLSEKQSAASAYIAYERTSLCLTVYLAAPRIRLARFSLPLPPGRPDPPPNTFGLISLSALLLLALTWYVPIQALPSLFRPPA